MQVRRQGELPGLPAQEEVSYAYYQPNPEGRSVGDCAIRALSKALGKTWEEMYTSLVLDGFLRGDLPNADDVWGRHLQSQGFARHWIPNDCPDCCTVARFAQEHPDGVYVLSMPGRHVVTVAGGQYWDSWDSGREVPTYYFAKEG